MNMSSLFQESARYVSFPQKPMAMILMIISTAKKAKMKWSKFWRIRHRRLAHSWSLHGWYMPRVTQFRIITHMLRRSNHVYNVKEDMFEC